MKRPLCYVCVAFVVTVFLYLQQMQQTASSPIVPEGSKVTVLGEVYHKEYKGGKLVLYLRHIKPLQSNQEKNQWNIEMDKKELRILCYIEADEEPAQAYPEPKLGSVVAVTGKAGAFRKARNPGGFDMEQYYRILKLDFQLWETKCIAQSDSYSYYKENLYQLRRYFEGILDVVMSEKDAAILKAMLLGNKTQLDAESKLLYQKSGISHIFAISGLHISLIGMGLYYLLRKIRLPAVAASLCSILLMIAYGDMVGMSSSAFRAIVMFSMKMLAGMLHRTYDMLNALAVAAVLLLIEQPLYLYYSGFLLSFGAILGVGCVLESIQPENAASNDNRRRGREHKTLSTICSVLGDKMKQSLCGSLSIFLIHFPIMLCTYYEFPLYSFFLNLLIIPLMTIVMGLGLFVLACGSLPIPVLGMAMAKLAALGNHMLFWFFERISTLSLSLPATNWIVGKPDSWRIWCFYGCVLFLYLMHEWGKRQSKKDICVKKCMRITLPFAYKVILIIVAVSMISGRAICGLGITFLDVGQGDGFWIETPQGHHYLIDGGSTSEKEVGQYILEPFLKYSGTTKLEAVYLTHLDQDHISGVVELLESSNGIGSGIDIGKIVIAKAAIQDEAYWKVAALCEKKGISLEFAAAGDVFTLEKDIQLEVLHPTADYQPSSRNAYSLVMRLMYKDKNGEFGVLFTGDAEEDAEEAIVSYLAKQNWKCQIYKAAHHGSKYSNTAELLAYLNPPITVISCGARNRYGHPHKETLERLGQVGSNVINTKETGAVSVQVVQGKIKISYSLPCR